MNFFEYNATNVWIANNEINVLLADGREAKAAITKLPLLAKASIEQLNNFVVIDGYALYWKDLGEDLSIAGFFENQTEIVDAVAASPEVSL